MQKEHIIVTAGIFDPLELSELQFLKKCKKKGDWLIVGIHSDEWMIERHGAFFQNYETRREIIESLDCVDEVLSFSDRDGTIKQLLQLVRIFYTGASITCISQTDVENMPERKMRGIKFETLK